MRQNPIRLVRVKDAFNCCKRTQRNYAKDNHFYSMRLNTWFIFVRDKGPEFRAKDEEQLDLFG
ncbi:hypothetical protein SAMN02745132_02590 [Enterovibrio nigricans DSM 22720]|uniref:Uncharacterized protein n=1 Tax=Enterovibrio nigricans DSM 22720 TaxID=1121868 RepID=A0A1T4UV27_9GAMM|nr:hypothetical protein SAMN02745132_02590 [Enterovibrio nigricans DSM 22720]